MSTARNGGRMNMHTADQPARRLVVLSVLLGTFTVSLSNTALNPAVPALMSAFSADAPLASWIITGFMLGMGMIMPLTGYLGARFGKKRVYLTGLAGFLAGSALGMLAPSMAWVIAARTLQGVASGLMIPLSLALIFDVYPKAERGRVMGHWSMAVMIAPALGPVAGGLLLELSGWPMLFAINLPLGLLAWPLAARSLPDDGKRARQPFDWPGFLLIATGLGTLLIVLSGVRSLNEAARPANLALILAGLLCLLLFVAVELRKPHPLLDLRIFAIRTYWVSVVLVAVQSVGMFGCLVLVPLLLQTALGFGAGLTGLVLLATALATSAFSGLGGKWLDSRGPRGAVTAGLLISGGATMAFGLLPQHAAFSLILVLMAARGVGLGLSYMPVTTAGLSCVSEDLVTQGAAMNNILRRLIASVAIVVVSVYFQIRSDTLAAGGAAAIAAQGIALRECFIAIGLLILASAPLTLLFPAQAKRPVLAGSAA